MKPPFRFSLLGLFAVTTIVALGIALYLARARLAIADAEVRRLRSETGYLTIDDPNQVHVISVPTTDALHWRWRIYLPAGHDFAVNAHRGKFDQQGYPTQGVMAVHSRIGGQTNPREPREIVLDVSLDKTLEGNPCLRVRENGQGFSAIHFDTQLPSWLADRMYSEKRAGQRDVVAANIDTPLGLLQLDGVGSAGDTADDAVLVWISEFQRGSATAKAFREKGILPPRS